MTANARKLLQRTEADTRNRILAEFLQLQSRMKVRFADLIREIENQRKLTGSVPVSFLFERSRLATLLVDLGTEITAILPIVAASVSQAQREAVQIAGLEFEKFVQTESNQKQIVRFNPQAVREFVGNMQDKTPIRDYLDNLKLPVAENVKNAIIDAIANGDSSQKLASDLNTVIGSGAANALTLARTEQNQAFRQASISHYKENPDITNGYIWLAACDLRTCLICWSRHGLVFPLNKKPQSHPNCRCTICPLLPDMKMLETGEELFKKLTAAQKKAILGEKRFELYETENLKLADFVGERKTAFGVSPYIKNLADLPKTKKSGSGKKSPAPQNKTNKPENIELPGNIAF